MPEFTVQQHPQMPSQALPIVSIGLGGIVHDSHYPAYKKAGFNVTKVAPNKLRKA
jgi:hypothetical protein